MVAPVPAPRSCLARGRSFSRNEKGAVLTLSGRQVGLIANADLSRLAISLR